MLSRPITAKRPRLTLHSLPLWGRTGEGVIRVKPWLLGFLSPQTLSLGSPPERGFFPSLQACDYGSPGGNSECLARNEDSTMYEPANYEAWYRTPRGAWIAEREFALMMALLRPRRPGTLLDVGAGTGHFSRAFAAAGLNVTALDPSSAMLRFARERGGARGYVLGSAGRLPFPDGSFDYGAAVTSLCFVSDPERALGELWRVSRRGVVLGLLNRRSLLYRRKAGTGGYRGARWDSVDAARRWARSLPKGGKLHWGTAIFLPSGGAPARAAEKLIPNRLPWGGFLATCLTKERT